MAEPIDADTQRALELLDEIRRTTPLETGPVTLSEEYLRMVEAVEAMPEDQSGADKTWVERVLRQSREHFAKARLVD